MAPQKGHVRNRWRSRIPLRATPFALREGRARRSHAQARVFLLLARREEGVEVEEQLLHRSVGVLYVHYLFILNGRDEQARTMPPRYAFRLEDLRVFHQVRASCHACGHKAIIPNATLLQGRGNYTRLIDLERQLRCRKCGARGKASLDVELRPRD